MGDPVNPLLLPVVVVQGLQVRRSTVVLDPAAGPTSGTVEGSGRALRLAVVGESTAAGCGVDSHEDGFVGALARIVARRTGRAVEWQVVGQYGATARRVRYKLVPQVGTDLDLAVVLAGVNDVLTRRSSGDWSEDVTGIVADLAERSEHVAVAGLPSFAEFPALPTTLGRYLAERATMLDQVADQVCREHPRATWVPAAGVLPMQPTYFARDGFHPSGECYRVWAEAVADAVDLDALARSRA
jgi:lysophospholipase L1-like esterase